MDKYLLLKAYAEGNLSDEQHSLLEKLIESGDILLEELDGFSDLQETLSEGEGFSTSHVDELFYQSIQSDNTTEKSNKTTKKSTWNRILPIVFVAMAFIAGWFFSGNTEKGKNDFGPEPNQQIASTELTRTLLNTNNVAEKINVVSATKINAETDEKIIQALLFSLNNDPSSNVRLACIDALYAFANLPQVRQGFIQSISAQTSPIVLSRLADAINAGGTLPAGEFRDKINKELPDPLLETMEDTFLNI